MLCQRAKQSVEIERIESSIGSAQIPNCSRADDVTA